MALVSLLSNVIVEELYIYKVSYGNKVEYEHNFNTSPKISLDTRRPSLTIRQT